MEVRQDAATPPPVLDYGTGPEMSRRRLAKNFGIFAVVAILGALLGTAAGWLTAPKPVYRATVILQISSIPMGVSLPPGTRALDASEIPATGEKIRSALVTKAFRQKIIADLKRTTPATPPLTLEELSGILKINYVHDTTLFKLEATHPNAISASEIANAAARQASKHFRGTAPSVTVLSFSTPPFAPSNNPQRFIVLSGLAGAIVLPVGVWMIRRRPGIG
jgi:capsular polysaccharide biosynthesis protein